MDKKWEYPISLILRLPDEEEPKHIMARNGDHLILLNPGEVQVFQRILSGKPSLWKKASSAALWKKMHEL